MLTDAVYRAPRGTGRGGNNFSGAGVLVKLPSGGEALLLAESLSVPDFVGMMKDTKNGELQAQGKVIDSNPRIRRSTTASTRTPSPTGLQTAG